MSSLPADDSPTRSNIQGLDEDLDRIDLAPIFSTSFLDSFAISRKAMVKARADEKLKIDMGKKD